MDFVGEHYYNYTEHYYKLNRILLVCVGLWPYDTSFLKKIQIIFFEALFMSFLLCQLNVFLLKNCSAELVMKVLMFLFITLFFTVQYNAGVLLTDTFKYIFSRLRYDWKMLKNQTEFDIIQKYADRTRFHTTLFTLLATSVCLGIVVLCSVPSILDIIIPLNESRPSWLPIVAEYFVDQERYFYVIVIHIFIVLYAGCMVLVASGGMILGYVMHNCAIFKIAIYRIEHIFDEKILQMSKHVREYVLYERLIHAVHLHRRAVELFGQYLDEQFGDSIFHITNMWSSFYEFQCFSSLSCTDTLKRHTRTISLLRCYTFSVVLRIFGKLHWTRYHRPQHKCFSNNI
ncbi:uncharacterized protein LOC105287140 isoform X4 [Ooceraea biroi]|uniref:uncharacterized protein LOC105287140 isoform X4 n=1 Tax=Ooceraea biroi TaxID=2015173 RepID=UPI00097160CF|nr:uncharacterized protein LOC105287140 isoform X4 [Ooceraea biroi]